VSELWKFDAGLQLAGGEVETLWRYAAGSGDREIAEHRVALALLNDLDVPPSGARKGGRRASAT